MVFVGVPLLAYEVIEWISHNYTHYQTEEKYMWSHYLYYEYRKYKNNIFHPDDGIHVCCIIITGNVWLLLQETVND